MKRDDIIKILEGTHARAGRGVALGIYALIGLSVIVFTLDTMPNLTDQTKSILSVIENIIVAAFSIEYLLRMTCARKPLRYVFSFWGIIDLLSILPAILFMSPDFASMRVLRLIRLVRIMKLFRMNRALARIASAFTSIKDELLVFSLFSSIVVFLSAVGIYHFENASQPDVFSSIPASLWWAISTLTTVGYGDAYPITVGGKLFTAVIMVVGVGVVAIPAGLITAALTKDSASEDESQKREMLDGL